MVEIRSAVLESIDRSASVIRSLAGQADRIGAICEAVVGALRSGRKVLTCGHGGSAAEALHMAEELVGRFERDRRPLPAVALVADPTLLTCISNDYGFESIFPRQVEAHVRPGDVLVIFSTSGNGVGLRDAASLAMERGARAIGLLGKGGGQLADRTDPQLIVGSDETARIQEAHQVVMHIVLEAVDRAFAD